MKRGEHHTEETRIKMSKNHADMSGKNNPNYGKKLPPEIKAKISKTLTGRKQSKETIEKRRQKHLGSKRSEVTKKKMSEAKKGKKYPKLAGENNPNYGKRGKLSPNYGRKHTKEELLKMSESQKGKKVTDESRKKISLAGLGRKQSKETVEKRRQKLSGRKRSKEFIERMSGENHWNYGKHPSDLTREKMRQAQLNLPEETRQKMNEAVANRVISPKNKDTDIEKILQAYLTSYNIMFQKHIPMWGHPDILIGYNIVVFVDGDYWHNLDEHKERDLDVNQCYRELGFIVYRFWGRDIKKNIYSCLMKMCGDIILSDLEPELANEIRNYKDQ